ncbi:hypothetical protein EV659_10742 [Rhodothalassium salexigens DSM 2132]|uniref:Glutathione synthetase-like protein n=1 Tax=Rhodothalassium salexigens DSM 2132 TaxID=1188247 RepID=A0A4R2PDZ0_RHOSA|nr:hypothetical protein [Rhodothalassium salexigens]MBB4211984.1 hypothetical protein [Rhodothalassium salexigens DSM 2132]MBK1638646.1 hypothetical protein [Rhodothalassium salexigens DSM 2132]TCP33432.1 hypothetical protein EV659_10742 [Rhodothalassium salexigens DSM 2132]
MTLNLAYLACRETLPGSPHRRADAFEHDQTVACLDAALQAQGGRLSVHAWDDPDVDWGAYDAALIGTTWDYQDRPQAFLRTLERIAGRTRLANPPELVAWNLTKTYLRDLEARGAPVIETLWLDRPDPASWAATLARAFDRLGCDDLVVKRQTGANAVGQSRHRRGRAPDGPAPDGPVMIQPYLATVASEGEISFVFVAGALSHALVKRPAQGDYRVQSSYGGREETLSPEPADRAAAAGVLALLDQTPLYARVDMVRDRQGGLRLMELELIEPFLYPLQGPDLGARLVAALDRLPAVA